MNASELPNGTDRVVIGYTRLDLGIPVEGEYVNIRACESKTFSSLVPGAKYRITAWGLGKGIDEDRRRCQSPIMILDESTLSQGECLQYLHNSFTSIFPLILLSFAHAHYYYRFKLNIKNNEIIIHSNLKYFIL